MLMLMLMSSTTIAIHYTICSRTALGRFPLLRLRTDHGHRKDQDHYVKMVSWAGCDEDRNWTVKFYCLDVDSCGHSAQEAAYAIKMSTLQLISILKDLCGEVDIQLSMLTGDTGGGAAVQNIHPVLITNGTMGRKSKRLSCDIHNLFKALEIACADTWSRQGIGHKTPFQMIWLFVSLLLY